MMLRLRPATLEDADFLFRLRNDELTRRNSFNNALLDWDAHLAWLERRLATPDPILIGTLDGEPVGMVRADAGADAFQLSWAVDADHRGRGLGAALLKAAISQTPGPLAAVIKSANVASRRIAEAAGFRLESEHEDVCRYVRPAAT